MLDNCSNSGIINKEDMRQLEDMKGKKKKIRTFRQLYPEWLEFKSVHTNSTSYLNRISLDWFKYYDADMDGLIDRPLNELTQLELDSWAHKKIQQYNMTKKQYYNMSVILRQGLEYALQAGYIERNPFRDVKINVKMFHKKLKQRDSTQVFLTTEQPVIIEEMYRRFHNNPKDTAPLAIVLDFEIGARVGELVAIKTTDIQGKYLHIQREEVREYALQEDGLTYRVCGRCVVDYTKSDAGNRNIYLTAKARKIIQEILEANKINNESNNDFLFVKKGKRIEEENIIKLMRRGCKQAGISVKSMHKVRKTYISALIDSNLNINKIREQAGHSDERTTYGCYCFNRLTDIQSEQIIEQALNSPQRREPQDEHSKIIRFPSKSSYMIAQKPNPTLTDL